MRIVVLVPSAEYKNNAGARIRYGRLTAELAEVGATLSLESVPYFDPREGSCDVLIVSKCHDARSLVAAQVAKNRGVCVGLDLFDDYFSQQDDSRLGRYRLWLKQLLRTADFSLCSTERMAAVVRRHRASMPVHIINDPAPQVDRSRIMARLRDKLSRARSNRSVPLLWFGVGDNPNFPVGLSDLEAFSDEIRSIERLGMTVSLTVLTNERALNSAGLAQLRRLPVAPEIRIWSAEEEASSLDQSLISFLPVNAQPFSAAKSLNRAITALCAGTQVLSAGFPLYEPLGSFIYSDAGSFVEDVDAGELRLSPTSFDRFEACLTKLACAENEARALAAFLRQVRGDVKPGAGQAPIYLIHGRSTNVAAHDLVQATDGLSCSTPFTEAKLEFDVLFKVGGGGELVLLVSDRALARLNGVDAKRLTRVGPISGRNFWSVADERRASSGHEWASMSLPLQLALYPSVMEQIAERVAEVFEPGQVIISETSPLPFSANF